MQNLLNKIANPMIKVKGWGEVIEDEPQVAARLLTYLQQAPNYARYFPVSLDPEGHPQPEAVMQAAQTRVVAEVQLQRQNV